MIQACAKFRFLRTNHLLAGGLSTIIGKRSFLNNGRG